MTPQGGGWTATAVMARHYYHRRQGSHDPLDEAPTLITVS